MCAGEVLQLRGKHRKVAPAPEACRLQGLCPLLHIYALLTVRFLWDICDVKPHIFSVSVLVRLEYGQITLKFKG